MKNKFLQMLIAMVLVLSIVEANAQLNGNYSIDPSGSGDFETIQEAVDTLVSQGVDGPVAMGIAAGTYNEQILIPTIPGTSQNTKVTFRSQELDSTSVVITYGTTSYDYNYVLKFSGANDIIVSNLTLQNTSSDDYSRVITFEDKTERIELRNNHITGANEATLKYSSSIHYEDKSGNANIAQTIQVRDNYIEGAPYSICFEVYDDYGLENLIAGNDCKAPVYLEGQQNVEIKQNKIYYKDERDLLKLTDCHGRIKVLNNAIITENYYGSHDGMVISGCAAAEADSALIANNIIYTKGQSEVHGIDGIVIQNSSSIHVYHNTVYLNCYADQNYAITLNGNEAIDIQNNLFAVIQDGQVFKYDNAFHMDNNNLFTNGSYFAKVNFDEIPNLDSLQSLTGQHENATSFYPDFADEAEPESLVPRAANLNNTGVDLRAWVLFDYNRKTRNINPDVGAFEVDYHPELEAGLTHLTCYGDNSGAIELSPSGSGPFNYLWSTGATTKDLSGLDAGTYSVTVEGANGFETYGEYTLNAPDVISIDYEVTDAMCDSATGDISVYPSGGQGQFAYQWTTGDTTNFVDSLVSGVYIVTVTDDNGCSNFASISVDDNGGPEINSSVVTNVSCNGGADGAIDISGNGAVAYEWSNGAASEDINNLTAGIYEVTLTGESGCQTYEQYSVMQPESLAVWIQTTGATCGQANGTALANISGGTAPYYLSWSVGSAADTITDLELGTYALTVTDSNGCGLSKSFTINESGAPTIVLDSLIAGQCGAADGAAYVSVVGQNAPFEYQWSNGSTNEDLMNVDPGQYALSVTDSAGCNTFTIAEIPGNKPAVNPICMVTVDSGTYQNEIIWEQQYSANVDYYRIYKESYQSGVYNPIGTVDANQGGLFVDTLSDVMQRAWRYKLAVVDTCGYESQLSEHHKTIHLTMNIGLLNTVNLIWDRYEGFDYDTYYIHRRVGATWTLIDSVPASLHSYTDQNPVMDETLYYMITIEHPYGCDPESKVNRRTVRSNVSPPAPPAIWHDMPPYPPEGLYALEIGANSVELAWNPAVDDNGIAGYEVYQNGNYVTAVTDTTCTVSGLESNTEYDFYIKAFDNMGQYSGISDVIQVMTAVGIHDAQSMLAIYPNPATSEVFVHMKESAQKIKGQLLTIDGKIVKHVHDPNLQSGRLLRIDLSDVSSGLYILQVSSGQDLFRQKLIVK